MSMPTSRIQARLFTHHQVTVRAVPAHGFQARLWLDGRVFQETDPIYELPSEACTAGEEMLTRLLFDGSIAFAV